MVMIMSCPAAEKGELIDREYLRHRAKHKASR